MTFGDTGADPSPPPPVWRDILISIKIIFCNNFIYRPGPARCFLIRDKVWDVESQIFLSQEVVKTNKYCLKILKNVTLLFWNTPLPHVTFGDTVSYNIWFIL